MPRQRRQTIDPNQIPLILRGNGFENSIETKGVFSTTYLLRRLPEVDVYASEIDCDESFRIANDQWQRNKSLLGRLGEAFTRSDFLGHILNSLGWNALPEQLMPNMRTRKKPDYCLFSSREDLEVAASADDAETLFRKSATVLEAKKWAHPLDQLSGEETPGWFPSQQIQDYLNYAKDSSGNRFFNWAILTNGNEWRLYTEKSSVGAYFSFHLVKNDTFCTHDEYRLFYTLFHSASFIRDQSGICLLDLIREQSLQVQADLETNLRKRIFGVLEDLGTAFFTFEENRLSNNDLSAVYNNSLIFLFRLLFILYAESRGLLPVRIYGPGANQRYVNEFSLSRQIGKLRDNILYTDNAFTDLYEDLLKLFNLINGTRPKQNITLGVTRYNGGLFNPDTYQEINNWRIGNKSLADILRQLIFAQPPARSNQRQLQLSTEEAIDYSTIEVRQLGDIYEGLLGAHFVRNNGSLELRNEKGQNHRQGIYYTPDWIVQFLIRETLTPLLKEIEESEEVKQAIQAESEERQRNNSFALGILKLNLIDPAMGSGHFLVRATEWLAEKIMLHLTTQPMTQQVIAQGSRAISREEIIARGKIPVPPGVSQEEYELAYWRRRVVEACIHGIDLNPMAVELAKLSLWLTCIAVDEPLNFLDHHLRCGNSLLCVNPEELNRAPIHSGVLEQETFNLGNKVQEVLSEVIRESLQIEELVSTEMEVVKAKERRWKATREKLQPLLNLANLWLAALDGLPMDELNYISAVKYIIEPESLDREPKRVAKRFLDSIKDQLSQKISDLSPFHWRFEFPDVYYNETGEELPVDQCGFDAVLGNPPYVSTHTAMEPSNQKMRNALERRAGYLEDLYVHFTDFGFIQLRRGGRFGFIVSDTFFTLASKLQMREMLQRQRLNWLGQCDPFDATVDAAIFVAEKNEPETDHRYCFIQARPLRRDDSSKTEPEKKLPSLPPANELVWNLSPTDSIKHAEYAELRIHQVPLSLHISAHKKAFFEPRPCTLALFDLFNGHVKSLVHEWWNKIEDSGAFSAHLPEIRRYYETLRPGDITIVGLIAEGGQGMRTANNARFLAYLEGTEQAERIETKSREWSRAWLADEQIGPVFFQHLRAAGGDPARPTANRAAWEQAVHALREQFQPDRLGFSRTDLFRVAPIELIATEADFKYSFEHRKKELLQYWQNKTELNMFWDDPLEYEDIKITQSLFRGVQEISDEDFCLLCQLIQRWIAHENTGRFQRERIPREAIGLRSSENYIEPADGPRIATIYNGLYGRGKFVSFRKGDPEGNRWADNVPLFIDWSFLSVNWLSTSPLARWQGHKFFLSEGISYTLLGNHVALKAKLQPACIFDASGSRLTSVNNLVPPKVLLALFNSDVFSYYLKKLQKNTAAFEITDVRQVPVPIPLQAQNIILNELADLAIEAKRNELSNTVPENTLVERIREIAERLRTEAPRYLRPSAQDFLLATPTACLDVIQKAINWEAEKLYGVEGIGPFDEF